VKLDIRSYERTELVGPNRDRASFLNRDLPLYYVDYNDLAESGQNLASSRTRESCRNWFCSMARAATNR
jgi:hypothetical protein